MLRHNTDESRTQIPQMQKEDKKHIHSAQMQKEEDGMYLKLNSAIRKQIIDNSIDQNLFLYMTFIDFNQVYDKIKREKILQ